MLLTFFRGRTDLYTYNRKDLSRLGEQLFFIMYSSYNSIIRIVSKSGRKEIFMKKLSTLLFIIFSRWGLVVFLSYYAIFYLVILEVFPSSWMNDIATFVEPYYVTLRYIGIFMNIIICIMTIHFLVNYLQYKKYIIRRKTLSFVIAASIIQMLSFFCYSNLPIEAFINNEQLNRLNQLFWSFKLHIMELIALFLTGYVVAFYIGALSRVHFLTDVVLASKKPKK